MAAGPLITWPIASKREPWHLQSQVLSTSFQVTMQPRCVQTADISWRSPSASRYTAIFCAPRRTTAPEPALISSTFASPEVIQSAYCHAMLPASFANVRVAPSVMRCGS